MRTPGALFLRSAAAAVALAVAVPLPSSGGFFAPAQTSGEVRVKLYPMENVAGGSNQLVTFGLPLPRGSVRPAEINRLRVLRPTGQEIPAFVEMLTPWRHVADTSINGQSVRVARIQIQHTVQAIYPGFDEIIVEWGRTLRASNVTALQPVKNGWHTVGAGSFVAADGVQEPNVYAVLPAAWLAPGLLGAPVTPFDSGIVEARDDPSWALANQMNWPDPLLLQRAAKNFFYTTLNEDDPLATSPDRWVDYKTAAVGGEPWLYDRASTYYHLYFASGFIKTLREAVRAAQFYKSKLYAAGVVPAKAAGIFSLKITDPAGYVGGNGSMYSYNENLAYTYWLVGDDAMLQPIRDVAAAHEAYTEATRWKPAGNGGFTERHTALRFRANVVAYEVFGETSYRDRLLSQSGDFIWHQNGAGGALPAGRIDGGLWHTMNEHEGAGGATLMASPWMSVLLVESMLRAYAVSEDAGIADFIRRMGAFLLVATKRVLDNEYNYSGMIYKPDYITLYDGSTFAGEGSQGEHALEVGSAMAWADFFARLTGRPNPALAPRVQDLLYTYKRSVATWTRPDAPASAGYPAFRVSPARKYCWQYHPGLSLTFALTASAEPPAGSSGEPAGVDLSAVKVFPNPWRQDKHAHKSIRIEGLSPGLTVKLYTPSGRLVKTLRAADTFLDWDLTNESGDKAASGVYLYVVTDGQGASVQGKLGLVR